MKESSPTDGAFGRHPGLTAIEYAAINLRVPDSGTEWLDAMIRKARRDDLAARFAHAELNTCGMHEGAADALREAAAENAISVELQIGRNAYELADAVLMVGETP